MSSGCDRLELDAVIGGSTRHATSLFSLLRPSCYSFYFYKGIRSTTPASINKKACGRRK